MNDKPFPHGHMSCNMANNWLATWRNHLYALAACYLALPHRTFCLPASGAMTPYHFLCPHSSHTYRLPLGGPLYTRLDWTTSAFLCVGVRSWIRSARA